MNPQMEEQVARQRLEEARAEAARWKEYADAVALALAAGEA